MSRSARCVSDRCSFFSVSRSRSSAACACADAFASPPAAARRIASAASRICRADFVQLRPLLFARETLEPPRRFLDLIGQRALLRAAAAAAAC